MLLATGLLFPKFPFGCLPGILLLAAGRSLATHKRGIIAEFMK
jgi:hypothetical protein